MRDMTHISIYRVQSGDQHLVIFSSDSEELAEGFYRKFMTELDKAQKLGEWQIEREKELMS